MRDARVILQRSLSSHDYDQIRGNIPKSAQYGVLVSRLSMKYMKTTPHRCPNCRLISPALNEYEVCRKQRSEMDLGGLYVQH